MTMHKKMLWTTLSTVIVVPSICCASAVIDTKLSHDLNKANMKVIEAYYEIQKKRLSIKKRFNDISIDIKNDQEFF